MEKNEHGTHENIEELDISDLVDNELFLNEVLLKKFIFHSVQEQKVEKYFEFIFKIGRNEIAEYFISALLEIGEIGLTKKYFKKYEEKLLNEKKTSSITSFLEKFKHKVSFDKNPYLQVLQGEDFIVSKLNPVYLIKHYEYWQHLQPKIKIDVLNKLFLEKELKDSSSRKNTLKCLFDLVCLTPIEGERLYSQYKIKFPKVNEQENSRENINPEVKNKRSLYNNSRNTKKETPNFKELKSSLGFSDYIYELINLGEYDNALEEVQKVDDKLNRYLEIEILYLLKRDNDLKYKTALFLNNFSDDQKLRKRLIKISGIYEN